MWLLLLWLFVSVSLCPTYLSPPDKYEEKYSKMDNPYFLKKIFKQMRQNQYVFHYMQKILILKRGFENLWLQALQLLFLRYTLILDCNTTSVGDTHPKTQIWSLQAEVQLSAPVSPDAS